MCLLQKEKVTLQGEVEGNSFYAPSSVVWLVEVGLFDLVWL